MAFTRLDQDVLVNIASRLDLGDVACFLETCTSTAILQQPEQASSLLCTWLAHRVRYGAPLPSVTPQLLQRFPVSPAMAFQLRGLLASAVWLWGVRRPPGGPGLLFLHEPAQAVLYWLLTGAARHGWLDILAWALCLDMESSSQRLQDMDDNTTGQSAAADDGKPSPDVPKEQLQAVQACSHHSCFTTHLHVRLYRWLADEVQSLCSDALTHAVTSRHPACVQLLTDHSVADLGHVLAQLAANDDVPGLALLLHPRPAALSTPATDINSMWHGLLHAPHLLTGIAPHQAADAGPGDMAAPGGAEDAPFGLGVSVQLLHGTRQSALPVAARANARAAVEFMLRLGAPPMPALQAATEGGHSELVEWLLGKCQEAGHERRPVLGASLALAAQCGHLHLVTMLLQRGADVSWNSHQAFLVACGNGHLEICRTLIQWGTPVTASQGLGLAAAAMYGREPVVALLLALGADPNSPHGRPLSGAAVNGHTRIVEMLLEAGADGHFNEEEALSQAVNNGHLATARVILDHYTEHTVSQYRAEVTQGVSQLVPSLPSHTTTPADPSTSTHMVVDDSPAAGSTSRSGGSGGHEQPSTVLWPPSKLPKLNALLAKCPNCPNRSHPSSLAQLSLPVPVTSVHEAATAAAPAGEAATAAGTEGTSSRASAPQADAGMHESMPAPQGHTPGDHSQCPSTAELWAAARHELAVDATQYFAWYAIFCDGCGAVPIIGYRWRCRDCPRYFLPANVQPALQGFDLCDQCHRVAAEGIIPYDMPIHPTHIHQHHTMRKDKPPKAWTNLDDHAHMLAYLNCYEALHPEVPPPVLHHLAVMHVNQDPRRTRVTTEQLIGLLAPGTTRHYWESLLPPWTRESGAGTHPNPSSSSRGQSQRGAGMPFSGGDAGASCAGCGGVCADMAEQLQLGKGAGEAGLDDAGRQAHGVASEGSPAAEGPDGSTKGFAGGVGTAEGMEVDVATVDASNSDSDSDEEGDVGGWPVMPPPGFVLEDVVVNGLPGQGGVGVGGDGDNIIMPAWAQPQPALQP